MGIKVDNIKIGNRSVVAGAVNLPFLKGDEGKQGQEGKQGVGIKSVEQIVTSEENNGVNIIQVTLENGNKSSFEVRNGSSGEQQDYNDTFNKPKINNVELIGNKSLRELGILENEEDPTVPSYVKNIKQTDINNWNNKSNFSGSYNDLNNIPSNLAKKDENNNFSTSQTINGTLTINGNIVQNGQAYETHAEKVYTKNDEIITREGATGGLSKGEYAGIQAKKYDGVNDGRLGFNASGEARVGDVGDEQPLLTRDEVENLENGQLLKWDGTQLKAVGMSIAEKELLITYQDGTTETVKLVVYK